MTNNKQQTAVEWFANQLNRVVSNTTDALSHNHKELFEQAKAMEKEQMIKFAFDVYYDISNKMKVPFNLISENRFHAEQYYNETYKQD